MKHSNGSARRRSKRTDPKRRAQLLAAFERSGLSAAAFARQHRLHYTTFCGWRSRHAKAAPAFVQVELHQSAPSGDLLIELGAHCRMRLTSTAQIELAVRLLQALNASRAC